MTLRPRSCRSGGVNRDRDVGLDQFEAYLDKTGDKTPIFYLVEKFLSDPGVRREQALDTVTTLLEQLGPALAAAGVVLGRKR